MAKRKRPSRSSRSAARCGASTLSAQTLIGLGLNKIGRVRESAGHAVDARHDREGAAPRPRGREASRGRRHETQPDRRQARLRARSACASAAASARAWARPADAAARARPRARACASRASKAARCRCIAVCRSAASQHHVRSYELNEINLGRVQTAIDARLLDAKAAVDAAALVKAGVMRRAKDGVRLLGDGELKAKVDFRSGGPRNPPSPRSRRPAAR